MTLKQRVKLLLNLNPPTLDKDQIKTISLWRSIFWQGEYGAGFGDWKSDAEYEHRMQTQFNSVIG